MSKLFNQIKAQKPRKSLFDLSYSKTFTCDMGQLIPVMCDEVVPGDVFNINNEMVIRFQPLVAPVLHEINAYVHYFFVPYRLLMEDWEDFITGGKDGDYVAEVPSYVSTANDASTGSLWDYFGFPITDGIRVNAFPFRAYKLVYNEYYRDENLEDELDITDNTNVIKPLNRKWEKDYFTSSLPWQQRGTAPSLPISSYMNISGYDNLYLLTGQTKTIGSKSSESMTFEIGNDNSSPVTVEGSDPISFSSPGFNISDLRLAFQVQKWLERNARSGCRYTEQLRAHFGVSPRDERLQRPEYIGGSKSPIIVSEVLQTSSTDATTPQGNLAGHGLAADFSHACRYRATEYGLIIGLLSVMPRLTYTSQGVNRQWLRTNKYDYYWPEFANLSEQAIYKSEIFSTPANTNHIFAGTVTSDDLFGYQGRYDELRTKHNMVCGEIRDELSYWTMARDFVSPPSLNNEFVTCNPTKRIFAVQNRNGLIVSFGNNITALRPLPYLAEPGLIDHN